MRFSYQLEWPSVLIALTMLATVGYLVATGYPGLRQVETTEEATEVRRPMPLPAEAAVKVDTRHERLAASLRGTDIDGRLNADVDGNLIVDQSVRDFFDYILNTVGETTPDLAFIRDYAGQRLPPKAVRQLMALLDDYLAFREAAAALMQQPLVPESQQTPFYYLATLERAFDRLHDLRRQHMSALAVEAFFGLEESYTQYSLARAQIQLNPDFTAEEKQRRIAQLRHDLPAPIDQSIQARRQQAERAARVKAIVAAPGSLEEKRAALYEYHDIDTANRIVDQLRKDQSRNDKMAAYLRDRAMVCESGWSAQEQVQQLGQLKVRHFPNAQERAIAATHLARLERNRGVVESRCD